MRAALIDNEGNVVNVVLVPDDFTDTEWNGYTVHTLTDENVSPGWTFDGTDFIEPVKPPEPDPEPDELEEIKHRLISVEAYTGTVSKWMAPKTIDSAYPAGIRVEYKGDIYENTSGDYTMEEPSLHADWTLVPPE